MNQENDSEQQAASIESRGSFPLQRIVMPSKTYNVIYADPPWSYKDKRDKHPRLCGGASAHYKTMTIEDIKSLPVSSLAKENCMLFCWVTFPLLKEGIEVIEAWGFKYKTLGFSWLKTNKRQNVKQASFFPTDPDSFFGIGYYTKSNCEICLIGVKGKPIKESNSVSSALIAPIGRHSEKPDEARRRIVELCGDVPRVELFAREKRDGWDSWGNEVECDLFLKA